MKMASQADTVVDLCQEDIDVFASPASKQSTDTGTVSPHPK